MELIVAVKHRDASEQLGPAYGYRAQEDIELDVSRFPIQVKARAGNPKLWTHTLAKSPLQETAFLVHCELSEAQLTEAIKGALADLHLPGDIRTPWPTPQYALRDSDTDHVKQEDEQTV